MSAPSANSIPAAGADVSGAALSTAASPSSPLTHSHPGLLSPQPALGFCPIPDPSIVPDSSIIFHPPPNPDGTPSIGPGHFRGRHLLGTGGLTRAEIDRLMDVADYMAAVVAGPGMVPLAQGCILATLFFEPSTRTSSSFQAAMMRLGGQVLTIGDVTTSSVAKGETLEDTVRCLQCYVNIIAMRHHQEGAALRASQVLDIPFLNAGDGVGEHPTQALLDLYTLHGEFYGRVDGLTVTMVGDLKNGRTVHSLSKLLVHYNCKLRFVSPHSLRMPDSIKELLTERGITFTEHDTLDEVMRESDVLYVTRVQRERFSCPDEYDRVKDSFIITPDLLDRLSAKSSLRILHPLPRVNELSPELDVDPRAAYFRQMKHGLHVRMALIACLLGKA